MRKFIIYILIILNLFAATALIVSYLSVCISPADLWVPSFLGLAYPVIAGVNLFFVLLWLLLSPRYSLVSLVVILAGMGFIGKFIQLKGRNLESADIKVLSYNVQYFSGNGGDSMKETAREILTFLKEQKPDIICLQEVRLRQNEIFK